MNHLKKLFVLLLLTSILVACNGEKRSEQTTEDIIKAFKDAGLDVGEVADLDTKEFGKTREEGKYFLVPSLGDNSGGRIFKFKDKKGLDEAKSYYDGLGNSSPLLFSHTHKNGLFLLQINGTMEEEQFKKYKKAMDDKLK